jgi:alpha-tubulin suppressor-like RCC1 family protein
MTALEKMRIVQVSAGLESGLFLSDQCQVYVSSNEALAHMSSTDCEPRLIDDVAHLKVIQISEGDNFSLLLTHTGHVYAFGFLCDDFPFDEWVFLSRLSHLEIIQVSAGAYHMTLLTKTGQVFVCGDGEHRQLGLGDEYDRGEPELIETLNHLEIVQVSAGDYYSLFLTKTGQIYSCGSEFYGAPDSDDESENEGFEPTLVATLNQLDQS